MRPLPRMTAITLCAGALVLLTAASPTPFRWGQDGHEMAARAATTRLPASMPGFFRTAAAQLVYLDPEPDRWRSRELEAMDQAWSYDHYIDLENVPAAALEAPHRWSYLRALYEAGLERPERDAGFLPYRMLELYQRLVTEWRLWREAGEIERVWIEARILNDAGVLGHYVTDAAQPHHTTIHFNGWNDAAPNPEGFTTERDFHYRFESAFVGAHVAMDDVLAALPGTGQTGEPAALDDPWEAILEHILQSHGQVERLYRLEQEARFAEEGPPPEAHVAFAASRLASGADMLARLWWAAWVESAHPPAPEGR